ncbi:hypothetical protein [Winogradskyella sp.]|uniref:hypothetical protein n=1 Tax=Winogradskyella sp. TaxID=1883156 RepID=UPI002638E59B|nr:hypothetical protein [Winogradskyella sp.]
MKFKIVFFTLAIISFTNYSFSQIRIGDFNFDKYKHKKLNKKTLNRFTAKNTKFVLPKLYSKSTFEDILNEVWDVTSFELMMEDEFNESEVKVDDALAQFMNVGITRTKSSGMSVDYGFHILDFHVVDKIKKKPKEGQLKWHSSKIGTIYFTPDISLRQQAGAYSENLKGDLLNFRLGYFKNFLQFTNNSIKNNISIDLYEDYVKPELKNLKSNKIYIDKTFIYGYNAWKIKEKEAPEIEDLMKDFSFDYKIVEYEDIEKMILDNQNTDFYYLMYNQINSNKVITVINGNTGDIIYQQHTLMSYNLKSKDFKELNKKIKKIK